MDYIVNQKDIEELLLSDNILSGIHGLFGLPPNWSRPQGFVTLSRIILEQLVSLQSASAHFKKLNNYLSEFTPEEIIKLSDEEMRFCQVSRQKAKSLRSLSMAILEGRVDLNLLETKTHLQVKDELKTINGIGDWTADIYLIFALQAKDIFPSGDVAVMTTMKELTGLEKKEEIISFAEKWKPHRSLATFYLWNYYLKKRNRKDMEY